MGTQRKFEVLGWALVINNADKTCVICTGNSSIGTANDNIEVRAFNPKSNIRGWIDAHGLTCHNIEMLDQPENEMRMLSIQQPERIVNGDLVQPTLLDGTPIETTETIETITKPTFWQRWKLAILLAGGSAAAGVAYYVLAEVIDIF